MFYSIPVDNTQITTTTPIGAKCITHVFFESKNDGLFFYKKKQDSVTITIDGKMICRDMPILPFCTSIPYGLNRIDWHDVALEVGINVDMSEIKISAGEINDFSVVFVCSDKPNEEFKGFDFVECKRINMLGHSERRVEELLQELKSKHRTFINNEYLDYYNFFYINVPCSTKEEADGTNYWQPKGLYQKFKDIVIEDLPQKGTIAQYRKNLKIKESDLNGCKPLIRDGKQYYPYYRLCSEKAVEIDQTYLSDFKFDENHQVTSYNCYFPYKKGMIMLAQNDTERTTKVYCITPTDDQWRTIISAYLGEEKQLSQLGMELTIPLDHEPQQVFFSQLSSRTTRADKPQVLQHFDCRLKVSIGGADKEEIPPKTDMQLFQQNENIPWRKCAHTFEQEMPRTISVTLDVRDEHYVYQSLGSYFRTAELPKTWDLYIFFIYKRLI